MPWEAAQAGCVCELSWDVTTPWEQASREGGQVLHVQEIFTPTCSERKRFGNPRSVGVSGWDATGGIPTHCGLEDEDVRYFPGWTLGPQEARNCTCGLQYETLERVNTWRRFSGLQPREVKRQHMYLHISRHPRGPEELILTPPLLSHSPSFASCCVCAKPKKREKNNCGARNDQCELQPTNASRAVGEVLLCSVGRVSSQGRPSWKGMLALTPKKRF